MDGVMSARTNAGHVYVPSVGRPGRVLRRSRSPGEKREIRHVVWVVRGFWSLCLFVVKEVVFDGGSLGRNLKHPGGLVDGFGV